ncbi:hypothetical protein HYT92_02660 [Candidatus Pacearchaeota archaeon]|nr:hypothetical protein [Candidatus Pacearchaeota archaeon]
MNPQYSGRCIQNMGRDLSSVLPIVNLSPDRYYDTIRFEYKGRKQKVESIMASEVAELTLQNGGSAPVFADDNYKGEGFRVEPDLTSPVKKIVAYIAGLNCDCDMLIISDSVNQETGNLDLPARLFLSNLIRYKTFEKIAIQ